jgi:hypothetical protein
MTKDQYWFGLRRHSAALAVATVLACVGPTIASAQSNDGPVRLVHFTSISGTVEWRPDGSSSWSDAVTNLPIRQGAQVWAPEGGRAELLFDDGTVLRLAANSTVTFQTLYSDKNGEFTEMKLNQGYAYLHAPHAYSIYQFDTPDASVNATGPARLRLNVGGDVKLALYNGRAAVENSSGTTAVTTGEYAEIESPTTTVALRSMPAPDAWDGYNSTRDTVVFHSDPYVPTNIGLVSGDLGSYGSWRDDPDYHHVWVPAESAGWRPYYHGHWAFVEPYGWTWVGAEPWGWAPYHYGSWVHRSYGWGWYPGPASQYWSPAVVSFNYGGGDVCWAPLCPSEVRYPSALTIGFGGGNWSLFFSIGGAAVYCPDSLGYCSPHPWMNVYLNGRGGWGAGAGFYNNVSVVNNRFVPYNSRFGGGVQASLAGFRGNTGFRPMGNNGYRSFQHGTALAFSGSRAPFSGPPAARPDPKSFTPTRSFASRAPNAATLNRRVVQGSARSFANARSATAMRAQPGRTGSFGRPNAATAARAGNRSTGTAARWNPNAKTNPAAAAAAARGALHYNSRAGGAAVARAAHTTNQAGSRAMHMGNRGAAKATRANPAAPRSRNAAATRTNTAARRNRATNARTGNRAAAARRTAPARTNAARTVRNHTSARRAPQRQAAPRSAPQRQARQRSAPRQTRQRSAPQQRQAPQRQAPQRQAAPRGGGGNRGGGNRGGNNKRRGG